MPRRFQVEPHPSASDNANRRNAKPNVFKSLNWKKELDRVLKKSWVRIPAAKTRQEIRRRFGNEAECEMLTPETIALKCPVSYKRIQVATKGVNCRHMQCFDLSSFIQIRVCSNRWYCPLCETETKLDQLRIIEFVNGILHATNASVERVELLGDGSFRTLAQVEIDPDVKINDELPYTALEDVKPDVGEGCQALSEAMDVERELHVNSAMTASSEREDAFVLEDVKPIVALQPAQSHTGVASDEAQDSVCKDFKPVITRGETKCTKGSSEDIDSQRTDLDEDDNLKVLLKASNAEVQRISQELCTERAARLALEQKVSQLRKDLDETKAFFDERQQKRVQEDRENAVLLE
ncbi:MIZ/SP-RING zinc finger, partial [Aphelenchoides avenae]